MDGLRPTDFDELATPANQWRGQALIGSQVLEAESGLVGEPTVIGGIVVDTCVAKNLVLAGVDLNPGVCGVLERRALHLLKIPRPCPESIWRGGEGTDRADLDGVAREVGGERQVREGVDLGRVAPVLELNQRIAGDLVGEAGALGAEDATLPVEQNELGDRDWLLE